MVVVVRNHPRPQWQFRVPATIRPPIRQVGSFLYLLGTPGGLDCVSAAKRSKGEWDGIVARMVFLGAPVSADEAKTVTSYLEAKFGR
jgi:hypothetical protein